MSRRDNLGSVQHAAEPARSATKSPENFGVTVSAIGAAMGIVMADPFLVGRIRAIRVEADALLRPGHSTLSSLGKFPLFRNQAAHFPARSSWQWRYPRTGADRHL